MPSIASCLPRGRAIIAGAALALSLALLGGTAASETRQFDHAGLARQALEQHIRPGYDRLAAAAGRFAQAMSRFCTAPAAGDEAVIAAFDDLVTAWGRIEHIEFGPVTEETRRERIMFWPDRRNLGARQIARAIAARDASVTDAAQLASKSVALQGIGALEIVLFSDAGLERAAAEDRAYRCRFGSAIAGNIDSIANEVAGAWNDDTGFAGYWLRPGGKNPTYLLASETTLALAKAFNQGLERARDERIAGPLGLNKQRRETPAPLAVSGRSMRLVIANIEGARDLYDRGGLRAAVLAAASGDANDKELAELVSRELATALERLEPVRQAAKPYVERNSRQQIVSSGFPLKNARLIAGELLVRNAGLSLGFNESDGD
jgi:predicted lipoprotein